MPLEQRTALYRGQKFASQRDDLFCYGFAIDHSPKTSIRSLRAGLSAWRLWALCLLILGIVLCVLMIVVAPARRSEAPVSAPVPPSPQAMEEEALALQDKGEHAAAEQLFRECLTERQRVLGPEHIDTLAAMNNLANLLHVRGNNAEAEMLHRQALEARERTLGSHIRIRLPV
jgi:tetratricopeptide (TPR) repeat protein